MGLRPTISCSIARDGLETYNLAASSSRLGLDSLELRHLRYGLLLTYKIVFGLTDVVASDMFTVTSSLHYINTRGHAYKLYPHNSRIDVRKIFFLNGLSHLGTIYLPQGNTK